MRRIAFLVSLVMLLQTGLQVSRADDDQQVFAAQVAAGRILNVRDAPFFAQGDGRTDDTDALQAAINAASDLALNPDVAQILLMPPGRYRITRTLFVRSTNRFRLIGAGGATIIYWEGDNASPALALYNVANSEFANFGIHCGNPFRLQTGLLIADDPDLPGRSTQNLFRNCADGGNLNEVGLGLQIGRPGIVERQNNGHRFINCTFANYSDTGIRIVSPAARDLLFFNVILQPAVPVPYGISSQGGGYYWLNGGTNNAAVGFLVGSPTGPVSINLSNNEGNSSFVRADAGTDRMDLTIDHGRFASVPSENFVTLQGAGNVRMRENKFFLSDKTAALPPGCFVINRTGAASGDVFEYSCNRIHGRHPAQAETASGLFPGQLPTEGYDNHYWSDPSATDSSIWHAGTYPQFTTGTPAPFDTTALDAALDRVRGSNNAEALFIGRTGGASRIVNVREPPFNAHGDGVTDDTAAFQAAIQNLQRSDGWHEGLLLVPAGDYVISQSLLIDSSNGIHVAGEGSSRSRLIWQGAAGSSGPILDFAGHHGGLIRGLGFALAPGAGVQIGLRLRSSGMVASRNNICDVTIDGSAGTLDTALKVGDGPDANNDFHLFQNVAVSGYRSIGFSVMHSQIYNLLFIDCWANGAPPGAGFVSQTGVNLGDGTLAWFGGGGGNHASSDLNVSTGGNAPVIFHRATFAGSPRLLITGGPNFNPIALEFDHVDFTSTGSNNNFISLFPAGVIVVQNCTFRLNQAQKLHHFGDYSSYFELKNAAMIDADKAAIASLNGFSFLNNTVVSTGAHWQDFFAGSVPTVAANNVMESPGQSGGGTDWPAMPPWSATVSILSN